MIPSLFIPSIFLGFASLIFYIFESIALHVFWKFSFNIGIPVFNKKIDVRTENLDLTYNQEIKVDEGIFLFTKDRKVYFRSQMKFFEFLRFNSPFPLKCIALLTNSNTIDLKVRIPLGMSMFFCFWIIGWMTGPFLMIFDFQGLSIESAFSGMIGIIAPLIMAIISYYVEKKRLNVMLEELTKIINKAKRQ